MKHPLFEEIDKFRVWSKGFSELPEEERWGEWEEEYEHWDRIESAFADFIRSTNVEDWTNAISTALLYIIARDNESETLADLVSEYPEKLVFLAQQAVNAESPTSKWLLTIRLPRLSDKKLAESLLLDFIDNSDEYVRRRTLMSLAQVGSSQTEHYCKKAWQRSDPYQEYQRMMVLHALFEIKSPLLQQYIEEAKRDGRRYLVENAVDIERRVRTA
jgi:hypothetical protein